jgi:hypothetical protein
MKELKKNLTSIIKKIDFKEVVLDVENFVENKQILEFLRENGKNWIIEEIEKW